jgi:hypothetical protein
VSMDLLSASGLLSIIGFCFGLCTIGIVFAIIKRTKSAIRQGFGFLLIGMIAFVSLETFKIFELFLILPQTIAPELFTVIFIFFLVIGLYKLKTLIKNLSDFGQVFLITSKDKYESKLVDLVKNIRGICYLTLEEPYEKIVDVFDLYGIDTSGFHFLDASGGECNAKNCVMVKNNPSDIKSSLDRVLKEKDIKCVIVDNVSALKNVEKFEMPLFIQDAASLIKSNGAQGFFIGKIESLDKQTINDISMIMDRVLGDEKW